MHSPNFDYTSTVPPGGMSFNKNGSHAMHLTEKLVVLRQPI